MQLTKFTDYALRVLIYTQGAGDRLVTIDQISDAYGISRSHLMKVVNVLTREGYLIAVRGRSGGLRLGMPPDEICVGAVVRATEPDFHLVECHADSGQCVISSHCKLRGIMGDALGQFLAVLDQYTLVDLALKPREYRKTLALG